MTGTGSGSRWKSVVNVHFQNASRFIASLLSASGSMVAAICNNLDCIETQWVLVAYLVVTMHAFRCQKVGARP